MADQTPGTAPVTDHRKPPRGVLPRGAQAWLMAALALGLLAIIMITGRPAPPARSAPATASQPTAPNPDRLRDYQDRLRVLDERSRQQAQVDAVPPSAPVLYEDGGATPVDPLEEEEAHLLGEPWKPRRHLRHRHSWVDHQIEEGTGI